ncbi:MAG: PAS domain S-box protein [Nitrospira sp.]|nr:PAS domain S-box protein [Nitrospira sp.]
MSQEIQSQANELARKNKELRQAHLKAEEESQKYRYLYETIPVASYTLDAQGTVLDLNEAGAMLLRSSRHHLVDRRFHVFIYESDRSLFRGFMRKVLKGAGHELCAVRLADDQTLSLVLVGVRRNNHERKRAVVQLAVMDVTGFIRVQGVLRDSNEALEATVNERTEQLTDALGRLNQEIEERRCAEDRLSLLNDSLEQRVNERTIALAEANERWEWVVRATHDGVWDWDLVRNKAYFSPRWKEMHGIQDGDLSESSEEWSSRIHPEDQQKVGDKLEAYLAGIVPEFWEEYRIQRKDGIYIWVLDRGVAVFDEEGRAIRMVGAETDITWRKESEEALRRSEQEFRTLADNVPALFSYIGLDFRYRFVNKRYEELFGRHDKTMVGMTVFDLLGSDGYAVVEPYLRKALEGESVAFEYELKVPGDGIRYLSVQYVPDRGKQGEVRGLFALLADVTALKLSEAALRGREAELRALNAKLVQVQEEERRRIARDLHDDVTQRLAALTLELHGMKRYAVEAGCDPSIVSKVKGLGESVERLTTDVQQLAHHLHPSILEHAGLEAAAREHADEFSARTGLLTEVLVRDLPKEVPLDQATCLYRVLQESLQNVRKHANASNVLVRLLGTNHGVGICVHDDGQGLESKTAGNRKGLGLTSMAERVWSLKGTFRVRTRPDDGTEIHAWVPLEDVKYKT